MEIMDAYNLMNQQTALNNSWSAQMAANNMNFQLDMANTAHQREVQDLKAAGLNPILSAHGNGAPVGSGAMATPDTNNSAMLASILKDMIASNTSIGIANAKPAGGGYEPQNNNGDPAEGNENVWTTDDPEFITTAGVKNTAKQLKGFVAFLPKWMQGPLNKGLTVMQNNAAAIAKGINHAGGKKWTDTTNDMTNQWADQNIFEGMNF